MDLSKHFELNRKKKKERRRMRMLGLTCYFSFILIGIVFIAIMHFTAGKFIPVDIVAVIYAFIFAVGLLVNFCLRMKKEGFDKITITFFCFFLVCLSQFIQAIFHFWLKIY